MKETEVKVPSKGIKCIHGKYGARYERGSLTNDACGHCQAMKVTAAGR